MKTRKIEHELKNNVIVLKEKLELWRVFTSSPELEYLLEQYTLPISMKQYRSSQTYTITDTPTKEHSLCYMTHKEQKIYITADIKLKTETNKFEDPNKFEGDT